MHARQPPLNALRAFEAAGRHLSFAKAAEELRVTPAAISHQIRTLEEHFGVALFRRLTRRVELTDAARAILPPVREGFECFAEAGARVHDMLAADMLTVTTAPTFAGSWLIPRLENLRRAIPGVEVRLDATDRIVDLRRGGADVGIRYGTGNYPGLRAEPLTLEAAFPVCGPKLVQGPDAIRTPDDLRRAQLLHTDWMGSEGSPLDWSMWLRTAGVEGVDVTRGMRFDVAGMAIQAAADGHGVALADAINAADFLAEGRLTRPFEGLIAHNGAFGYYVVWAPEKDGDPRVRSFVAWLRAETEETMARIHGRGSAA